MEVKKIVTEIKDEFRISKDILYLKSEIIASSVKKQVDALENNIVKGLELHGFVFDKKEHLLFFMENNCSRTSTRYHDRYVSIYSVNGKPFLKSITRNAIKKNTIDKAISFDVLVEYEFINN